MSAISERIQCFCVSLWGDRGGVNVGNDCCCWFFWSIDYNHPVYSVSATEIEWCTSPILISRALGRELIPVYRQSATSRLLQAIHPAVGCRYFPPGMQLPQRLYWPRKDERLSWPGWLTCSGWFTHNIGHPSAASRAWDRESFPARDRRSTTVPRNQHKWGEMSEMNILLEAQVYENLLWSLPPSPIRSTQSQPLYWRVAIDIILTYPWLRRMQIYIK